jgi:hypothetical protein
MTRIITANLHGMDTTFWDFVYQAIVIGLGVIATLAVFVQINNP